MHEPAGLELHELTVAFGGRVVLGPVSLSIPPRGITCLIGESGSGKTALLRALNRMHALQPQACVTGRVMLEGTDLLDPVIPDREVRRRMGMVFADTPALPGSVRGNLTFALGLHARPRRADREAMLQAALQQSGLWPASRRLLETPARLLSPLDRQRLAIARALIIGCQVLLLDDPSSGLDGAATRALEDLLERLKQRWPILLATSQVGQAARCSDRLVMLAQGRVAAAGTAVQVLDSPANRAFLTGRVQ